MGQSGPVAKPPVGDRWACCWRSKQRQNRKIKIRNPTEIQGLLPWTSWHTLVQSMLLFPNQEQKLQACHSSRGGNRDNPLGAQGLRDAPEQMSVDSGWPPHVLQGDEDSENWTHHNRSQGRVPAPTWGSKELVSEDRGRPGKRDARLPHQDLDHPYGSPAPRPLHPHTGSSSCIKTPIPAPGLSADDRVSPYKQPRENAFTASVCLDPYMAYSTLKGELVAMKHT